MWLLAYAATSSLSHFGYSKKVNQENWNPSHTLLINKIKSGAMSILPCTAIEEMWMALAVTTMLLLAKRITRANSTWTFLQDHLPQGKYLLLFHHPQMNKMNLTQLWMHLKSCLTSAVSEMHQCTTCLPQTSVSCSLWKLLMG